MTTPGPAQPHDPWYPYVPGHTYVPADPPLTWAKVVVTVAATVGMFLVGGVVCAVVWAAVAEPPTYPADLPMFAGQPVPNGEGLERTFNIEATFLLTAGTGALILGALAGIAFRGNGVATVLSVLAGSVAGYVTMRYLGLGLGPEALAAQARGAGAHATLLEPLRIHATGVYFAWPVGALAGVMAALCAFAPEPTVTVGTTSPKPTPGTLPPR